MLACAGCVKTTGEVCAETERETVRSEINAAAGTPPIVSYGKATNVVIFICFSDEDPNFIRSSIPSDFVDRLNGEDNSIKDYYNDLSYGKFVFNSIYPTNANGSIYIYQDVHTRSYYTNNSNSSGSGRTGPESALLNNAVYEASSHLSLINNPLDVNNDGYVDCVTFIISGNYSESNWNKIMWPHSWQLDDISKEYDSSSSSASLSGKKVNDYTFLFLGTVSTKLGLMCHELGHAVGGLPDLYHYNSTQSKYLPVGYWDLMHLDCDTPQFMTTYLRWKYLSFVNDNQIVEMEKSGDYTLTPTTTTGSDGTLAYKLTIDNGAATPNESIWIEYRRTDVSTYDCDLPGSGLLVYRVNTEAKEGNKNAKYQNASYPDEVFVFRPDVSQKSSTSEKEKENLSYAYLSNNNQKFSVLGDATGTTRYDQSCIYLSNGKNTGIVITIVSESAEQVTFHIELAGYDSSEINYGASYVQGNTKNKNEVEIYYGEDIMSHISLFIKRNNRGIYRADDESITLLGGDELYQICEKGKNAYLEYTDDFGTYTFEYFLIIHDKLESKAATVLSLPTKTTYAADEEFSLSGLAIKVSYSSGDRTIVYSQENADSWTVYGYDMSKSGQQEITVDYNGDVKIHFSILVRSALVSLRIDERNTTHLKRVGENPLQPTYNVIATYSGGLEMALGQEEYTVQTGTESNYARTEVVIRAKSDPDVSCTGYYYTLPSSATATAIGMVGTLKQSYKYGESLDLSSASIQITFGEFSLDGNNALPLNNYLSQMDGYKPNQPGKQTLRVTIDEATYPFEVNVLPIPNSILYVGDEDVSVSETTSTIVLDRQFSLSELSQKISCYLDIAFTYTVGKDEFTITPDTYGELLLQSDLKIVLRNKSGAEIKSYSVCLSGDGNDDGKITDDDVVYWKMAIINKEEHSKGITFDRNGDGLYTLTDYVLLLDRLREEK